MFKEISYGTKTLYICEKDGDYFNKVDEAFYQDIKSATFFSSEKECQSSIRHYTSYNLDMYKTLKVEVTTFIKVV